MLRNMTRRQARREAMDSPFDLFNRFIGQPDFASEFPSINLWADDDGAVLTSELPGVDMKDLELTVSGKQITIKGSRATPDLEVSNAQLVRQERMEGNFERAVQLPFNIEAGKVTAKLQNGVLEIAIPRAEIDKPRKIAVGT